MFTRSLALMGHRKLCTRLDFHQHHRNCNSRTCRFTYLGFHVRHFKTDEGAIYLTTLANVTTADAGLQPACVYCSSDVSFEIKR